MYQNGPQNGTKRGSEEVLEAIFLKNTKISNPTTIYNTLPCRPPQKIDRIGPFGHKNPSKKCFKNRPRKKTAQKVHPKTEKRCKVDPLWGPFWHQNDSEVLIQGGLEPLCAKISAKRRLGGAIGPQKAQKIAKQLQKHTHDS